jgi:hypothetical protein
MARTKTATGAFGKTALATANVIGPPKKKPRVRPKPVAPDIATMQKLDARALAVMRRNRVRKKIAVSLAFEQYQAIVEFMEARNFSLRESVEYLVRLGLRASNNDAPVDDGPFGLPPQNGHARPMDTFRDLVLAGRQNHDVPLETRGGMEYREAVLAAQREADAAPLRELARGLAGMMPASVRPSARYPMPPAPAAWSAPPEPEAPGLFDGEPAVPVAEEPVFEAGETMLVPDAVE